VSFTVQRLLPVLALALMLGAGRPAHASVVVPLSLPQLTEEAELVVDATVVDVRSMQGPDGIERLVQVLVGSTWKGRAGATVYVRLAGGRLGATETRMPGVPALQVGDRLVLFLVAHPRGGYSVLGLHQGALVAVTGADGTPRVLAPARGAGVRGDVARAPRRMEELETEVRSLASTGLAR
jgi:hypothetical protein